MGLIAYMIKANMNAIQRNRRFPRPNPTMAVMRYSQSRTHRVKPNSMYHRPRKDGADLDLGDSTKDQAVQIQRASFPWREGIWGSRGGFPDVHIRHETSSIFNCHGGSSLLAKG